jgi:hypothetical protein
VGLCGKKGKFPVTIQDTLSPTIMNNSSQEFYMGEICSKNKKKKHFSWISIGIKWQVV